MMFCETNRSNAAGTTFYPMSRLGDPLSICCHSVLEWNANTVECRREYMVKRDSNPARASGTLYIFVDGLILQEASSANAEGTTFFEVVVVGSSPTSLNPAPCVSEDLTQGTVAQW